MAIPKTLTVREAMTATGFTRSQVYRLVHRQEWESVRVSNAQTSTIRIIESSIKSWFERQQQGSAAPRVLDADHGLPVVPNPFA